MSIALPKWYDIPACRNMKFVILAHIIIISDNIVNIFLLSWTTFLLTEYFYGDTMKESLMQLGVL